MLDLAGKNTDEADFYLIVLENTLPDRKGLTYTMPYRYNGAGARHVAQQLYRFPHARVNSIVGVRLK